MAIKDIVVGGIGPSEAKYIPTRGFLAAPLAFVQSTEGKPTFPSQYQGMMLPVIYSDPLWKTDRRGYLGTMMGEVTGKQFSLTDTVGYDRAITTLAVPREEVDLWLSEGLGRHIVIRDPDLDVCFEGFVNKIEGKTGKKSKTIGPLIEMANEGGVMYSIADTSTNPPTLGRRTITAFTIDPISQAIYGVRQAVLSQGGSDAATALKVRDVYFAENAYPPTSTNDNFEAVEMDTGLTLEILGYYYTMENYVIDSTSTSVFTVTAQLQWLLQECPIAGMFSTDYSNMDTNTVTVSRWEDNQSRAKSKVEELVILGDATDNPYNFGVYKDRKVHYKKVPTTIEYRYLMTDIGGIIEDSAGNIVRPWNLLPGRWMRTPDFIAGVTQPTLRSDYRNSFIVSVEFSDPYSVRIVADEMDNIPQLLAKVQRGVNITG